MAERVGRTTIGGRRRRGTVGLARGEDGTVTVFALFVFVVILMVAGLAIDSMRHERERARLQSTLDRAVLAAADLEQALDPADVVRDYFAAAGMDDALTVDPVVEDVMAQDLFSRDLLVSRTVTASASRTMPTLLLGLVGVETLVAATDAQAREAKLDVEISLVLDVSSSMLSYDRGRNMKAAASEFVETVMPRPEDQGTTGLVSLSLVPYSMTVNLGADLLARYAVQREHDYSSCVILGDADFRSTDLRPSQARRQYPHYDHGDAGYEATEPRRIRIPLCPRGQTNVMIPLATDRRVVTDAIAGLQFWGSTGIDAGMRWGVAMLDPDSRPVVDGLVRDDRVATAAAGRPLDYGGENSIKVAVLMTDGDPDPQRDLRPALRSGWSNVWHDTVTDRYSVLLRGRAIANYPYASVLAGSTITQCGHKMTRAEIDALPADEPGIMRVAPGSRDDDCAPRWYWVDEARIHDEWVNSSKGAFRDHPQSGAAAAFRASGASADSDGDGVADRYDWDAVGWTPRRGGLRRLTNQEVLDRFTGVDSREFLYRHPRNEGWLTGAEWTILGEPKVETTSVDGAVARLDELCAAAKARGVVIYTIGFELDRIDDAGKRRKARKLMSECASSGAHYFDVDAVQISEAFSTIATQISQLRLTR